MPTRLTAVLSLLMLLGSCGGAAAAAAATVAVEGSSLSLPAALYGREDALVPVRPLAEALGATVTWDGERRTVAVAWPGHAVLLVIGRPSALVDGRWVSLEVPPILVGGRTLVLLSFLAGQLGSDVRWDAATSTFVVRPPAGARAPAPSPSARGRHLVLGYASVDYPGDRSWQAAVEGHRQELDLVAYFGLRLTADGTLLNPTGGQPGELLAAARRQGLPVLLTVHNVLASGFDRAAVSALLDDPAARARAVESIHRAVRGGFAGVNLDLENLEPRHRRAYADFLRQVADRLRPEGFLVTVAVPAKTADRPWDGWSGAFDYAALGGIADYLVVMAYDEHWPGSDPGPIASVGWVEQVVRYALTAVPAHKLLLGVPAYGYDWSAGGPARGLTAPAAARQAARLGATVNWDAAAQVPYYHYWDARGVRHTVYFENASSMAAKVDLAVRYRLAGIALWRLGSEDPACWQGVIAGKLRP